MTHWHLTEPREWGLNDSNRFSTPRMRTERVAPTDLVAYTPDELVECMAATRDALIERYKLDEAALGQSGILTAEDRARADEVRHWMAECGLDVCAMLAVGSRRIVHYNAYAMGERECAAH